MTEKDKPDSPDILGVAPEPHQEEDFATMFAASEAGQRPRTRVEVGDLVQGRVIALGQNSAFIAVGGKGEAVVDLEEFRDPSSGEIKLAVGDAIEATIVDDGQRSGSIILKRTLGRGGHLPAELEQALAHRIAIEGIVSGENKGGFDVQIGSVRAFCPWSQIDLRRGPERPMAAQYIGQRLRFHVIKIESGGRNVVVSRRELLQEESAAQAEQTWARLAVGAVMDGVVTSLRDFGAFVDLGGVEGLIHISEMGYGRVKHPSELLTVGQSVQAQVVKIDARESESGQSRRQIGLSLKALEVDPWTTVVDRFRVGSTVSGTVRRVEGFGAFVELAPGLEGLVHVSKLVLDRRIAHARQVVDVGQVVDVTVLAVDAEHRRISLSMIEHAREARDSALAQEKQDERSVIAETNLRKSFGSFADLLSGTKTKKNQG